MKKGEKMSDELKLKMSLARKGKKLSDEHRRNLSLSHKGKMPSNIEMLRTYNIGRKLSEETIEKIRQSNLGKKHNISKEGLERMRVKNYDVWNKGTLKTYKIICNTCATEIETTQKDKKYCSADCFHKSTKGEGSYKWIDDRELIVGRHNRNFHDPETKQWRSKVYSRDSFKCKINNDECKGRIEAHHILTWKEYPELRYDADNGITLCHLHHPKTRVLEKQLADYFKSLIS